MSYSEWPQWLAIGLLILPVVMWPVARVARRKPVSAEWVGRYLSVVLSKAAWWYILNAGGFWS